MPATPLEALGDLVRPAGPDDSVGGVAARHVAEPTSTAQVSAVLRAAAAAGLTVVVRGAGTRQSWAAPPRRLDLLLDTRRLTGVVEHAAGDLIAVVRAGTTMRDLQAVLAPAGQHLALDAADGDATVGGTVAVASAGPRRMLYGTVRDLLIGITAVRADGVVAHAGGKVVKNVAGYDLGKLLAGSYGTLAVITRCAFRLHPLPAAEAVVTTTVPDAAQAGRLVAAVLGAQLVPAAVEIDAPPTGGQSGNGGQSGSGGRAGSVRVAVAVEGVPAGVAQRVASLRELLGPASVVGRPDWWGSYPWGDGGTGLKITGVLSRVPDLLDAARSAADRHGVPLTVRGSAGTGVLYAGAPADTAPQAVANVVAELRVAAAQALGHAVVVTAPAAVRDRVDLWGPVDGLALMRRVKDRFDPDGRLAPGRFVGGI